jgi:anti-sigma factor RsiW
MSLPDENRLAEALCRGKFTPDEDAQLRAYLATHPEDHADWEEELSLNYLLDQAPNAPVSSNFTARVMQAAAQARPCRGSALANLWRRWAGQHWIPRTATIAATVVLGLFAYHQHQVNVRQEVARTLAAMVTGNSLDVLQNFDEIERLAQVPHDVERDLIAALQ